MGGQDGCLRTPPFCNILRGCTVRRVMELATEHLVGSDLSAVSNQERIPLKDLYDAKEIFLVSGDTHAYACVSLDGRKVGSGRPGPVMMRIKELLEKDAREGAGADHEEILPTHSEEMAMCMRDIVQGFPLPVMR